MRRRIWARYHNSRQNDGSVWCSTPFRKAGTGTTTVFVVQQGSGSGAGGEGYRNAGKHTALSSLVEAEEQ